jgi:diphthamide synthase (EF-2-diphthine--ammonia ligase)
VAFGDLFLADVRAYRERLLAGSGLTPLFPLWGEPTATLAERCCALGVEARLVCVDTTQLPAEFVGRAFDRSLLAELPPGVDPCGERGEFHTFVARAPGFAERVPYVVGEVVRRGDRFVYCDLVPALAPR